MMHLALAVLLCVVALAMQANGYTSTGAFTTSLLFINDSELAAARTWFTSILRNFPDPS